MEGWQAVRRAAPAKVELVREHLAERFPDARIRVRAPGQDQPVVFMLRWADLRDERIRVSWDRFRDYESAEEILPDEALESLELCASILVTRDGIVLESYFE